MDLNDTVLLCVIERNLCIAAQFHWWDGSRKCFPSLWICWWLV